MKQLFKRATSNPPLFFRRLRNFAIILTGVGTAIITLPASIITLPVIVTNIAGYLIAAGTVAATVSQLPVEDVSILEDKTEQPN